MLTFVGCDNEPTWFSHTRTHVQSFFAILFKLKVLDKFHLDIMKHVKKYVTNNSWNVTDIIRLIIINLIPLKVLQFTSLARASCFHKNDHSQSTIEAAEECKQAAKHSYS